ncbi:hypothetical protein P8452_33075 [Trifolium repens]|nr:hypothetical protein P8452_33075 [Trifolium repens]
MCSEDLVEAVDDLGVIHMAGHNEHGLHCLALNTAIFWNRKNEPLQVAQQASNIEDLTENGKLSRSLKSHCAAIICLNWEEDSHVISDDHCHTSFLLQKNIKLIHSFFLQSYPNM